MKARKRRATLSTGGCCSLGKREEGKEACHRLPVVLDPYVPGAQHLVRLAFLVYQRPQHRGILGLDDRVGPLGGAADDLDAVLVHHCAETVLPEPQLVARVEPLGGLRVERRPEGEDEGIDLQRGFAGPPGGASTLVPQRHDNRLELQPPFRELVASRGRRRRELTPSYCPDAFQLARPLGEDIGAHTRQARPEGGEGLRPQQETSHHQERPSLTYQVKCMCSGAAVIVRAHGNRARDVASKVLNQTNSFLV
jgi:hypothetical protein